MKRYSEICNKNYFKMPEGNEGAKDGVSLMYFVDMQMHGGKSLGLKILKKEGILFSEKESIPVIGRYALVGVYIDLTQLQQFEECMKRLERVASMHSREYVDARIAILDEIVVLE